MVRAAFAVLLCAACQGQGQGSGGAGSAIGPPVPRDVRGSDDASGSATALAVDEPELPDPGDAGRVLAELDAIPAWQAVVDRARLLGRRGQRGVVYGRVGPALLVPGSIAASTGDAGVTVDASLVASPHVWLIDDTEGNGALGIRTALGDKAQEGQRIAAGGAWQLDAERRWFWKADAVQALPPAPASDLKEPPPPVPSHTITTGELPEGARAISAARDHDVVYFQIAGSPPMTEGDGWQVADPSGGPPVAVMNLPGERASYGGHDLRAADERWQLKRGQTYWVRIGKVRRRSPDKPATVNARTAPVRVP